MGATRPTTSRQLDNELEDPYRGIVYAYSNSQTILRNISGCRFNWLKKLTETLIKNLIEFLIKKALKNYTKKVMKLVGCKCILFKFELNQIFDQLFSQLF